MRELLYAEALHLDVATIPRGICRTCRLVIGPPCGSLTEFMFRLSADPPDWLSGARPPAGPDGFFGPAAPAGLCVTARSCYTRAVLTNLDDLHLPAPVPRAGRPGTTAR